MVQGVGCRVHLSLAFSAAFSSLKDTKLDVVGVKMRAMPSLISSMRTWCRI